METGTTGVIRTAFATVYCSQCGNAFGPGPAGFSSCKEHRKPDPEIEFFSRELKGNITCTYEADDEVLNYQFGVLTGSIELLSVFVGGIDMTQHMTDSALKVVEYELGAALQKRKEIAA